MKKKILFVLALAAVLSACKMKLSENTGTVVIDFGGNERAVDSNGLPIIKDAAMSLEIISSNGSEKKEFAAGQEKTWSGSFPIGEKLTIKVSLSTASAEWKGSAEHTVTAGTNTVGVKIKKAAAALNSLLFGANKPHESHSGSSGGVPDYTLMLKIASKEVKKEHIVYHNFCRDNKARTYFVYQEPSNCKLERYTSEGNREDKTFTLPAGCRSPMLAEDHATGAVYLVAKDGLNMKLYRINEVGGSPIELTGASLGYLTGYAVYNNVLIASGYGMGGPELKMYRITGDQLSEITLSAQPDLREDTKIAFDTPGHYMHGEINSLYMTEDSFYLLFSGYEHSAQHFSLGGIVKYSYSANGPTASISNPVRIGIDDSHTSDGNGIYPTKESNFYGPVKVVGFDEENLYIADDGVTFEYQKGKPRITANKNRIATLNKGTNALTFTNAPSGITWLGEDPVWTGVNTKTIVWKKNSAGHGFDYYQITQAADTLPSEAFGVGESQTVGSDHKFTDMFCFDEAGNLYIVRDRTGGYCICRFELKDGGSYDQEPSIMTNNLFASPTAIAVDISGSVKKDGQSVNALYYSYDGSNKSCIKRLTWANAAFSSAAEDNSFAVGGTLEGPQDTTGSSKTKTRFTALAADTNGFFVALKKETGYSRYTVRVQKYTHVNGSAVGGAINVLDEVTNASTWSRPGDLTALHIQEGILYGLTAVQYRYEYDDTDPSNTYYKKDSISGKLMKIGSSTADFSGNAEVLYTTELPRDEIPGPDADEKRKEGGKFAPYRFIAVKPKKLIVASDGFWGYITNLSIPSSDDVKQFNFIWDFSIKADGSLGGTPQSKKADSAIEFSKTLERTSGCGYEWK